MLGDEVKMDGGASEVPDTTAAVAVVDRPWETTDPDGVDAAPRLRDESAAVDNAVEPSPVERFDSTELERLGGELRDIVDPLEWADHPDQRGQMLESAHQHVAAAYGIEGAPPLEYSEELRPQEQYGQYDFSSGNVTLGSWVLDEASPDAAIETIAHENFHAYEHQVIAGELSHPEGESKRAEWADAASAYVPPLVDFDDYMNNPLERDAYAAERPVIDGYRGTGK